MTSSDVLNRLSAKTNHSLWAQSNERMTMTSIERTLAMEGIHTTRQTVKNTIERWKKTRDVTDCLRTGFLVKAPNDHYHCIDEAIAMNDELTVSDLKDILTKRFDADKIQSDVRTITRDRNDLSWSFTTAQYCEAIREAKKTKRLDWCGDRIKEETFDNVIFSDESTFQLEYHRRKNFCKKTTPRKLKYRHKHPLKIHVWGGISKQGATQLVIFSGIMNATKYGDILSASFLPFIQEEFPDGHQLYQDSDPKHTSKCIQHFFERNSVTWWNRPAERPDLNPIELVWRSMKTYLRNKRKPKNLEELKDGI